MAPSEDAVRRQLDRLLASAGFANAGRMSRFLKFVVEKTLVGEGERLKEYVIGVEVFDRDANYDPRVDAIVRVEAARLRTKLAEYYARRRPRRCRRGEPAEGRLFARHEARASRDSARAQRRRRSRLAQRPTTDRTAP